jgi:hypothetical protein
MKKLALCSMFFLVLVSCKKENNPDTQIEDSKQQLKKLVLLSNTGGPSYELATYQYNSEGRIITEGSKTYVRDDKQRIVRILEPGTPTNRPDIHVYYSSPESNKIAYTLCTFDSGEKDSVVYVHDNAGRLQKKLSYYSYLSTNNLPGGTYLSHYDVFVYDESGNLIQLDFYNISLGQQVSHCGQYKFFDYDNKNNPQYADDEVRAMEYFCQGAMNASKNNFTRSNDMMKVYTYRADGRPRSCVVTSGTQKFTLIFEYQ